MKKMFFAVFAAALLVGCGTQTAEVTDKTDWEAARIDVYVQTPLIGVTDAVAAKYNDEHPKHTVVFHADTADNIISAVNGGECDIVIANDETIAYLSEIGAVDKDSVCELISDRYVRVMTDEEIPREDIMLGSEAVYAPVTVTEELAEPADPYSAAMTRGGADMSGAAYSFFKYISSYKAANVYEWYGFKLR